MIVYLVFVLLGSSQAAATGCEIDPRRDDAPLLISPGTTDIVYPKYGEDKIKFNVGDDVDIACPEQHVVLNGKSSTSIVTATCVNDIVFEIEGKRFRWNQIRCTRGPHSTSKLTGNSCEGGGIEGEVGFHLDNERFAKVIKICFDYANQITLYSHYNLTSSIASAAKGTPRPYFYQDSSFYSIKNVNNCYIRRTQRQTVNRLLGLSNTDTKYIANTNYFLSRGHLTARADLFYGAMMNATFKYINCVPQWQTFNGVNWNSIESEVRNYSSSKNVNLQVWTGSYGTATLPHSQTKKEVELYLYVSGNNKQLPIPALMWKILYNPIQKQGVVLIGLNNPYDENVKRNIICNDVSKSIKSFLQFDATNIKKGYSYACSVPDFLKKVTYAPKLNVTRLLI